MLAKNVNFGIILFTYRTDSPMFDFIENCLRHKSEIVIYEAAHAIVNLKNTSAKELASAVPVLQLFCSSPKPTLRFAAIRTLNKVAMKHPAAVTACNLELENLITDTNRSIATLAITTLLKGGFDYKKAIVDSIIIIIEENPEAKEAAAVSALAKFGAHCEELLPSCVVLLERCLLDTDDEVRDRATFYVNVLKQKQKALNSAYILNVVREPGDSAAKSSEKVVASRQDIYAEQLAAIPELANIGSLFKSSSLPVELTESETEYMVQCIKHTFGNYMVFQFDCTNTLNDQVLENVTVHMEPSEGFTILRQVPCPSLPYNKPGTTYTLARLPEDPTLVTGTFNCTLKFVVKDCDPNTGEPDDEGYEDEYVLEDVEVSVGDHVQKVMKPNFGASWEEVGPENELEDTYALSTMKTLEDAVKNIIQFMGMQPCERSDKVPEGKSSHTLYLAGVYRGGHDALVRAKLVVTDSGVNMQLTVRSTDPHVSEVLATAIG
ncbi:hypothetical protein KUTeg_008848 [Tegillarca granosa]|uniref:Coatomer subunit gamma n=1 Tax=Tegillarca granosa TaxID=220873 RepID=A0ABQ9FAC2_TEGGR|nr:hypothetical protein KUTeg_008848 [Tegillarca granosa]